MLTRIRIQNYKSLADVDVELGPLTVLVGQNGSGKSNFVDAIKFVSDSFRLNLETAVKVRGGMKRILGSNQKRSFHIDQHLEGSHDVYSGHYKIQIREDSEYGFSSESEDLELQNGSHLRFENGHFYDPDQERFTYQFEPTSLAIPHIHILDPNMSRVLVFNQNLKSMRFYQIMPSNIRKENAELPGPSLDNNAMNLISVLDRLKQDSLPRFEVIESALKSIVEDVDSLSFERFSDLLFLKILYKSKTDTRIERDLSQESDGTIAILAILTALYQNPTPSLITIEEPELYVHPGALVILADHIQEAAYRGQVIITTHSPELLARFEADSIRVVEKVDGQTKIGRISEKQKNAIRDHLFDAGELMTVEGLQREVSAE